MHHRRHLRPRRHRHEGGAGGRCGAHRGNAARRRLGARPRPRRARVSGFANPPQVVPAGPPARTGRNHRRVRPAAAFEAVARPAVEAGRTLLPSRSRPCSSTWTSLSGPARPERASSFPAARSSGSTPCERWPRARSAASRSRPASRRAVSPARRISSRTTSSIEGLTEPKLVFRGTAREAARGFPANVNVAAALSLAGIGPDRTTVEIWADPGVDRNVQSVRVSSEFAQAEMTIRNVPSAENPRTGRIIAPSIIACLRRMTAPLVAGT